DGPLVSVTETERLNQRAGNRADPPVVRSAIADQAAGRPVSQGEQDLPHQMRARIARHTDVVDVLWRQAGQLQAHLDRLMRKSGDVLDPPEALFLYRGHELAVT